MKLSILIPTVPERAAKLEKLLAELKRQGGEVEVLTLLTSSVKNGGPSVGVKRNELLKKAVGEYVCFVDDDDSVSADYIASIIAEMKTRPDAIVFECQYTNAESGHKSHVYFSRLHLNVNYDDKNRRVRMINHLCPVKREIALKAGFPDASFSEDTEYGMRLRNSRLIKTEAIIPKILYYYNFSSKTSLTWHLNPGNNPERRVSVPMVKMDVVMVSDGRKPDLYAMTQKAIDSIAGNNVNIIVVEKANVSYKNADRIPQSKPFNYNGCLNKGAKFGNAALICFTNNDVVFPEGFMDKIIEIQTNTKAEVINVKNQNGFMHNSIISGFCFIMTRRAYEKIGKLDDDYQFWCADNATSEQIKEHTLLEFRSDVKVTHLTSVSLNKLDKQTQSQYKEVCVKKFNRKFNQNVLNMGV